MQVMKRSRRLRKEVMTSMAGKVRRKLVAKVARERADSNWNGAKEQISLDPSSSEYRERQRDRAGVKKEDFVERPGLAGEQAGESVLPAQPEVTAPEELAGDLRQEAEAVIDGGKAVSTMKYKRAMSKSRQGDDLKATARAIAETTESKADDEHARVLARRKVDDLPEIRDDTVTEEEFVPKALQKYL